MTKKLLKKSRALNKYPFLALLNYRIIIFYNNSHNCYRKTITGSHLQNCCFVDDLSRDTREQTMHVIEISRDNRKETNRRGTMTKACDLLPLQLHDSVGISDGKTWTIVSWEVDPCSYMVIGNNGQTDVKIRRFLQLLPSDKEEKKIRALKVQDLNLSKLQNQRNTIQ